MYDDGIVLISPTAFVACNANTDPSVKKPKVAVLQPGRWTYKLGTHNRSTPVAQQYRALVQRTNSLLTSSVPGATMNHA